MPGTRAVERARGRRRARVVLAAVHGLASLVLLLAAFSKPILEHDEAISHLAACGTQEAWAAEVQDAAASVTHTVEGWTVSYYTPAAPLGFAAISRGLAETDLHPPLYFWLLHAAVLACGVQVWVGPLLNALLLLAAGPLVYRLARECALAREPAAWAAALWLLSPVSLTGYDARQYALLSLLAAALLCLGARAARIGFVAAPAAACWLVVLAAGWLTHFHFAILAAAVVGSTAWRLNGNGLGPDNQMNRIGRGTGGNRRALLALGAAVVGAAALSTALHPDFARSLLRHESWTGEEGALGLPRRLLMVARALGSAVVELETLRLVAREPWWLAAGLLVLPSVRFTPRAGVGSAVEARPNVRWLALVTGAVAAVLFALYLSGQSLPHAMGRRYLALAWPGAAVLCVAGVTRRWPTAAPRILAGLVAALVLSTMLEIRALAVRDVGAAAFADARAVLVDSTARGVVPRLFALVPEGAVLTAAPAGASGLPSAANAGRIDLVLLTGGPGAGTAPVGWELQVAVRNLGTLYKPRASD